MIDDVHDATPRYRAASQGFHAWFEERVQYLTGVDLDATRSDRRPASSSHGTRSRSELPPTVTRTLRRC